MPVIQIHCSSVEAYLSWKCCCYVTWIAWDILLVMSSVTGNLCNKCPKWLVEQNSSYSDYFNAISGFTLNSRAPGGPVTMTSNQIIKYISMTLKLSLTLSKLSIFYQTFVMYSSSFQLNLEIFEYSFNVLLRSFWQLFVFHLICTWRCGTYFPGFLF